MGPAAAGLFCFYAADARTGGCPDPSANTDRLARVDLHGPAYDRAMFDPAHAPDPELVYANYLKTCAMLGIESAPREQALGLIQEWTEVLSGRADPTIHTGEPMQ